MSEEKPTRPNPNPIDGSDRRVLEPGPLLVEMRFSRRFDGRVVQRALLAMGFGDGAGEAPVLDVSQSDAPLGGGVIEGLSEDVLGRLGPSDLWLDEGVSEGAMRFVGVLARPTALVDTDLVRWIGALPLSHDPFADIQKNVAPLTVETDRAYDLRFISRMRTGATRAQVVMTLAEMGFVARTLSCLKKNIHLPGRKGVDCAVWCAPRAVWTGPKTLLTVEEPLAFEDASPSPS